MYDIVYNVENLKHLKKIIIIFHADYQIMVWNLLKMAAPIPMYLSPIL